MSKKALIALSGGVDSAVALNLMLQNSYEVEGITMSLLDGDDQNALDAKSVADRASVPFSENCWKSVTKKELTFW